MRSHECKAIDVSHLKNILEYFGHFLLLISHPECTGHIHPLDREKRIFYFFSLRLRQWEGSPSKARPTEMQLDAAAPRISSPLLMSAL